MKGLFQCPPWAKSFCPLPFRYAPVTVGSGRVASKSFFLLGYFNRTARNNMLNSALAVALKRSLLLAARSISCYKTRKKQQEFFCINIHGQSLVNYEKKFHS